jgi:hypothetical protein
MDMRTAMDSNQGVITIQQDARIAPEGAHQSRREEMIWEGEPITLTRSFGDHYWLGLLSTVRLPGRHVHPEVRAAAQDVLDRQAELNELRRKLDARPGAREELMRASRQLSDRAERLQKFDSETEYIRSFDLPEAEQAVEAAWQDFAASLGVFHADWQAYLASARARAAEEAGKAVEAAVAALQELQLIDDLTWREGIVHNRPETPDEIKANFDRSQRRSSLAMHIGGEDRGSEGRQYGLIELVLEYKHG